MHDFETVTLLLLEDDPDDRRLLVGQLKNERTNFVVEWAQTLAEAIEKLKNQRFDVILSDLHLPDSGGLQTVLQLRSQCQWTPIIVLTAVEDEHLERDVMAAHAQDYLVKGEFGGRAVPRAILHVVQRQHAMDDITSLLIEQQQSQQRLQEQALLLQKKNDHLRKLNRTAQEFVDNVSHDFRTPLTVIKDYATIIREGMVGEINAEQQLMLDKVSVRVDDLNIMVDDLLDVSKLESGLLGAWRRECRVGDIFDRTESMLQQRAQVKQVQLQVECEATLPNVYCDSDKVGRVITNLAVNAIKFAGEGGHVTLRAESDPTRNQIIISITDDGPGIAQESLEQIFARFEQLEDAQASTKGYGLGLSIAQQICNLNLGELSVQSELGVGSTFSFTLPIVDFQEIVKRWLEARDAEANARQVIEVAVNQEIKSTEADELDKFLNCLLRRNDLLFRTDVNTWLIVMSVPQCESRVWFDRAEKEFQRTNRNRPLGPLPEYCASLRCEWEVDELTETVLKDFAALTEPTARLPLTVCTSKAVEQFA